MTTDNSNQEDLQFAGSAVDTNPIPLQRHVLVYVLLVTIVLITLGYSLVLVLNDELMQDDAIQVFVFVYPILVGIISLACILYAFMTPYVSEFKIGWVVVIAVGALMNLSAFVLPMFWYLHIWKPYRQSPHAPIENIA